MKKQLSDIYRILFNAYGPQGWWPIIITEQSEAIGQKNTQKDSTEVICKTGWICKYDLNAPRSENEIWEIITGAVLTQNTSWKNVEKALINLTEFASCSSQDSIIIKKFPTLQEISKMPLKELEQLIKPSGFYRQKSQLLKEFARFILSFKSIEDFAKKITREELLKQKGIGPETADSILLYACKKPAFVVDTYTKRIFSRIGLIEKSAKYDEIQKFFQDNIPKDIEIYKEYHALIVQHAKQYCQKKPICYKCPLNKKCRKLI